MARLPDAKREECDGKYAALSTERENCYKTHANAEFGGIAGESCSNGGKCDAGLKLCCGKATAPSNSKETDALKASGLTICDKANSSAYYHTPEGETLFESWTFECVEGAKYLSVGLTLLGFMSFMMYA